MKIAWFLSVLFLLGCGKSEPLIAGKMSERAICSTAGYLIRQSLGNNYQTAQEDCKVLSLGAGNVEIESGYKTPFGPTMRYTALAFVSGSKLRIEKIKVHTVDDNFLPFSKFPYR